MRNLLFAASILSLTVAAPALAQDAATLAADPVVALAPVPAGKLTDAAAPRAYRLDLTVDPGKERFSGKTEIDAVLKSPGRFIDLHGRDLTMRKAAAISGGRTYPGTWQQIEPTGVARLVFAEPLPAGPVTLQFEYDGAYNDGPAGLFRVRVGDDWYGWSQFQSIDARAAFPGFDEPGFKTPFTVTLRTPPGHKAVSNAPEVSKTLENGLEVHRFAPTLPLPTYLVAVMTGPFTAVAGEVAPTPQRARPLPLRIISTRQNADKLSFALEGSKGIVEHLETYFNDAFPYPKLDQITSPIMPGAMENAGADLYGDGIIVMDDGAPTAQKRNFGMVVAHELGHQWFGDLVTPAWWDDIWLNESFANWMGYRIGDEWRPDLNIGAGALAEGYRAMGTDALVAGRAIRQPIKTNAQIDEAFDSITYGKGGHVVAMIAGYMGDDKFRDGVRRYMAAHRYGNATTQEFFAAMAEAAGDQRITSAMLGFVEQQGVPLLTFERGKRGSWQVVQSRFARLGTTPPETRWGVPVCVRFGTDRGCQLLTDAAAPLTASGKGLFLPNAGGTGYYRFELPRKEWDALIAAAARLPGGEALALDDSLYASFQAGRASTKQLVALARNLAANPDSYASDAGIDNLEALAAAGLMDDKARAAYRKFVAALYRPRLAELGFDPRTGAYAGDDPEKSQRRQQVVGRMAGAARDADVRATLSNAANAFLAGDKAALDAAYYAPALAAWIAPGGLDSAKVLIDRALASEDPVFRPTALEVIGTSGDARTAGWILNELKDSRLRTSERLSLIRSVVQTGATRDMGFAWLKTNFEQLTTGSGGIFFTSRLPGMLSGYCSAERADEIAAMLRPRFAGRTGALELERTIERVRSCGVLKQARAKEFSRAISKLK